jgi:hypothetical protein
MNQAMPDDLLLPDVDASRVLQPQYCQLLIKMTIRRGKSGFIYLGNRPQT